MICCSLVVCVYFITSSGCLNFIWNKCKIKTSVIVFNINLTRFQINDHHMVRSMFMMLLNKEKGYLRSIVISGAFLYDVKCIVMFFRCSNNIQYFFIFFKEANNIQYLLI